MKDKIDQFIRDMKSVSYWNKVIIEKNLELESISVQLQGVSSIMIKPVIYENGSNPYSNQSKLSLIELESIKIDERQVVIDLIMRVDDTFEKIVNYPDFNVKECMVDLYILKGNKLNGKVLTIDDIIRKYNISVGTMYRIIKKSIKKALE